MKTRFQMILLLVVTSFGTNARGQEVSIPDPGLDAAIRATLGKPAGPLTVQDMLSLTNLMAGSRGVTSLEGLGAARNLTTLYLGIDLLTDFSFLTGLTSLTTLYVGNHELADFSFLHSLGSLTTLGLLTGPVIDFTFLSGLTNLTTLDLYGNPLTSLTLPAGITSLTSIDARYNQLTSLTLPAGLTNLMRLALTVNQLTNLTLPAGLTALTTLELSGNRLTSLTSPADLISLTNLDLSDNQLTSVTLPAGLTALTTLSLSGNQLPSLTLPAGLTSLTSLNLSYNHLTSFMLPADTTNLTTLDLSYNQLSSLTLPAGLKTLTTLNLSGNQLTSVTLLAGLEGLSTLDLRDNQITSLTLPAGLTNLTTLYLRHNPVTDFSFLNGLPNLTTFDLPDNQLFSPMGAHDAKEFPATLDLSFNPALDGPSAAAVVQDDDKLVVGGYDFPISRLNPDGTLDPSFHVRVGGFQVDRIDQLTRQRDGKLLLAGAYGPTCSCILRLFPDGSLDLAFPPSIDPNREAFTQVLPQNDGKLLAIAPPRLLRFNADGTLDATFRAPEFFRIQKISLDTGGKILVLDLKDSPLPNLFARLNTDGSRDPTFAPEVTGSVIDFLTLSDGRVLVLTIKPATGQQRVFALQPDGSLDSSFKSGELPNGRLLLELNGKVYASFFDDNFPGQLARLNSDGSEDASFPRAVFAASSDFTWFRPDIASAVLHKGALIIVGGFNVVNGSRRAGLARIFIENFPKQGFELKSGSDEYDVRDIVRMESEGANLIIRRVGATTEAASIHFATRDGSARAGVDYVATSGTVSFAPHEVEKPLLIPFLDDQAPTKRYLSFYVFLDDPAGSASVGPRAQITIVDDDLGILAESFHRETDGRVYFFLNRVRTFVPYPAFALQHVTVEFSDDLKQWTPLLLNKDDPAVVTDTVPPQQPQRFYRARYKQ